MQVTTSVFTGGVNKSFSVKTGVLGNVSNPRIPQNSIPQNSIADPVLPSPGLTGDNIAFDYQPVSIVESVVTVAFWL